MAKKKYEEANIQAIAEAIREKTGTDNTYDTSEMANGVNEVYEAGKKSEYDMFWDSFQNYGNRVAYAHAFHDWTAFREIKPKYKITPTSGRIRRMFYRCRYLRSISKDDFDLSQVPLLSSSQTNPSDGHQETFSGCGSLREIPDLGLQAAYYENTFYDCVVLQKIEILRSVENTTYNNYTFGYCSKLTDITIEGVIGRSIHFGYSPLTVESMKSVITHLKNYAGTDKEYTYTLTLSSASKTALEAEGATSPNNNLWIEYLDDIGWTLK